MSIYAQECLISLYGVFESSYRNPSPLLLYDKHGTLRKRLQSFQGVRQGDSLGSLAFSLAVQPMYVKAADHKETIDAVAIIQDDFTITGSAAAITHAIESVLANAESLNLKINFGKSRLLWAHATRDAPDDVCAIGRKYGIQIEYENMPLLGSIVGLNRKTASNDLHEKVKAKLDPFFAKLMSPHLDKQSALLLNRLIAQPNSRTSFVRCRRKYRKRQPNISMTKLRKSCDTL